MKYPRWLSQHRRGGGTTVGITHTQKGVLSMAFTKAELLATVTDCLHRSATGNAMTEQADADLAALDAVILKAGYYPEEIVRAAYGQE